jgi:hypothetical protein
LAAVSINQPVFVPGVDAALFYGAIIAGIVASIFVWKLMWDAMC